MTGSIDGTADLLFSRLGDKAFRFNYDIFSDYEVELHPHKWSIKNPTGLSINNSTASAAFWWKAFNYFIKDEEYISEEVKYIFREIYGWFLSRGLTKGTSPDFHRFRGKLNLLQTAGAFFTIPESACGWGWSLSKALPNSNATVAKSLSSGLTTTNKALFTTEVNLSKLDYRYPWFLQERIDAISDVTVFICGDKLFSFERIRTGMKGLDWRNQDDVFDIEQKWNPIVLSKNDLNNTKNFTKEIDVDWGRIDFLKRGNELIFLEYNANGQFGFLDDLNTHGVFDAVVDYLSK